MSHSGAVQITSIQLFCKAAELSSFSMAAEVAGVTPAAVSRSVGRIEERLGVRLFARSTRKLRLTEDGQLYYEQCRQALTQIEDVERAITGRQTVPTGTLRISAPTTYAHFRLLPLLPRFTATYPKINIEIDISNRNIDFVEEGFDLAIRLGTPKDSRLVARKLEDASMGVFAAPQYLQRRGEPKDLDELREHDSIQFVLPSTGRVMPWLFKQNGNEVNYSADSGVRCSGDVLGCVTYAKAGGGLFQTYHFIVAEELRQGKLCEVLQDLSSCSRPFSILYPQNRHLSVRVRAFVEFMAKEIVQAKV